jgi:hypothetical protein
MARIFNTMRQGPLKHQRKRNGTKADETHTDMSSLRDFQYLVTSDLLLPTCRPYGT